MRLTGTRAYYRPTPPKMPPGLVELIEGLTREVLKNNPTDIYGFCAGHMQQLLDVRDGPPKNKSLPLKEKIARAQEKVRQRAEKRRQKYDQDLLLQQQHNNQDLEVNTTSNEDEKSLQEPILTAVRIPTTAIHHEQDLVYSSETKASREPDTENTLSENSQFENTDEVTLKNDYVLKTDAIVTEHANETESDVTNADFIENEHATDQINLNNLDDNKDGQISNDEKQPIENIDSVTENSGLQDFVELNTEEHLSSPVKSITVNQDHALVDSGKKNIEDSAQIEAEKPVVNEPDQSDNVFVETDAKLQSKTVNLSNKIEDTQSPNDTQNIQHSADSDIANQATIIENVELPTDSDSIVSGNKEDMKEMNTINISFRESPTVELQDPILNTDMGESLIEKATDIDIVTLITQESINEEQKQHDLEHVDSNTIDINKLAESPVNTELNVTVPDHEDLSNKIENQMNAMDSNQKSVIVSNNNNTNANESSSENDTSTKLSEPPQNSNQESSGMDLETAAVTIQKVFRTFLFKSRADSTFDDSITDETIFLNEDDKNKEECDFPIVGSMNERRPHGITRMDTVLQTVNEEKSLSLSTDDSSTLSSAATVIQAHVRGFLVRNKLNSNKTVSTNSLAASNSYEPSLTSLEIDNDQNKNKTVLNIHIVPEGSNYLSRDESFITSMDLSLDGSPPSSLNLHPLGYDKSERRKQLKREDAIQSISPPSNNSGKLSEDVDSVKELPMNDHPTEEKESGYINSAKNDSLEGIREESTKSAHVENLTSETLKSNEISVDDKHDSDNVDPNIEQSITLTKMSSDEMDVVTPFVTNEEKTSSDTKLMHSGEFHDAVLPTKVSRSDASVASGE